MYESYELCDHLRPSEICLVVQQYKNGTFVRKFHEHVPSSRLSKDARINVLRALVSHFGGFHARSIVLGYLNRRGRTPGATNIFRIHTSYPEPGVMRFYCGANTVAWFDAVIAPDRFRAPALGTTELLTK